MLSKRPPAVIADSATAPAPVGRCGRLCRWHFPWEVWSRLDAVAPNVTSACPMKGRQPGPGTGYNTVRKVVTKKAGPPSLVQNCIQNPLGPAETHKKGAEHFLGKGGNNFSATLDRALERMRPPEGPDQAVQRAWTRPWSGMVRRWASQVDYFLREIEAKLKRASRAPERASYFPASTTARSGHYSLPSRFFRPCGAQSNKKNPSLKIFSALRG